MSDNREKTISDFREEIKHAYEPGAKIMSADRELRFCFELQRDRFAKRNLVCNEEMIDRGRFPQGFNRVRSWQDGRYETTWAVNFIDHKKTYTRDGNVQYKKKQKQSMYETVVDVRSGEDVSNDAYCCPNCGAVSTVSELQEGCAHCGTSFKMSELYPKVSNYFFVYDEAGSGKELFQKTVRYGLYMLPLTLGFFLWTSYSNQGIEPIQFIKEPGLLIKMIIGLIGTLPVVGFFGWFLSIWGKFIKTILTDLPLIFSVMSSRKSFARNMSRICPEYTFERFSARMMSLLKIVAYSERDEELPFYKGEQNDLFDDVVDITFRGTSTCRRVREKDNMVYVTADLYVETAHDLGTKIKVKKEKYRVTAGRRIDVPFSTNFSITAIQCRSCGGSFNVYKTKKCPYCGSEYRPEYDDWALYDIKKR
ncbi:MAG: hypothetical protein K6F93_02365 [Lachnospiraceae bacterium]|nr:hypothetical protein [Lachnospiraceae bacterium]